MLLCYVTSIRKAVFTFLVVVIGICISQKRLVAIGRGSELRRRLVIIDFRRVLGWLYSIRCLDCLVDAANMSAKGGVPDHIRRIGLAHLYRRLDDVLIIWIVE